MNKCVIRARNMQSGIRTLRSHNPTTQVIAEQTRRFPARQPLRQIQKACLLICALTVLCLIAVPAHAQYTLAWGDSFPGPSGSAPNPNYWMYLLGDQFGNGELDYGTNSRSNSYIDGKGDLVIVLLNNGTAATEQYTSAHLQTQGLVNVGPYGQVEADIQCPGTDGIGEAFWALGSNYATVGWPNCGEIDMMESHGSQPDQSNGTIHAPAYADYGITAAYVNGSSLTSSYNMYGMYWMPYRVQFFFNSDTYVTDDLTDLASNCQWPFNQSIFLIDSAGVGGQVAGSPDDTTVFPQYMYTHGVDWNAYSSGAPAAPGTLSGTANSNSVALTWGASSTSGVTYNIYMNTSNTTGSFSSENLGTLGEYNCTGTTWTAAGLQPSTTYYFEVVADNPGGESKPSNVLAITTQARGNSSEVQINCGGFSIGSFMGDNTVASMLTVGNPASDSAPPTYNTSGVTNPAPNNVYDSYCWAATTYNINDLNASTLYTVRLHFCEDEFTVAGARVFNVFLNGDPVLTNFDVYATAGAQNKVVIEQYTAMSDSTGNIRIDTTLGTANDPEISALEVIPNTGTNNLPGAPGGVTATAASANQVTVSWNAVSGAASYNVFRSETSSFTPSAATYGESTTGTSVTDNVMYTGTTYYYKVTAVNSTGQGSASGSIGVTTPTNGSVMAGINCGGAASGAFAVDQDFSGGTANTFTTTVSTALLSGSTIPSEAVLQTDREGNFGYTFSNLKNGQPVTVTLYFMENYFTAAGDRVFSVTANGNTVLSNFDIYATAGARYTAVQKSFNTYVNTAGQIALTFTPSVDNAQCCGILLSTGPNPAVPATPAAVAAPLAKTGIMVTWPATDTTITSYAIYRGTTSGGEGSTPIVANYTNFYGGVSNFEDASVVAGQTYYYKVTATNYAGTSGSAETSATPNPWPIPGIVYAANFDEGPNGTAYFSTAGGNYGGWYRTNPGDDVAIEQCSDTTETAVPYDVCDESLGQWIDYTVNVATTGSYTVTFEMASYGGALFHLQDQAGHNLTGELVPPTTDGFEVWAPISTTINLQAGVQTLRYVEDGNTWNFHYMTFASNGGLTAPAAPTGLTALAGNSQVALSWNISPDTYTYNIYRGTSSGGESATAIATGISTTTNPDSPDFVTYTDGTAVAGTTYYYKVAAVNPGGTSGESNEASGLPTSGSSAPINPSALVAAAGNTQVALSWTGSPGATSYDVYQGTTMGGELIIPIATGVTTTSYTNTGLLNGVTYFYTVGAVDSAGTSGFSNEASATPSGTVTIPSAPTGLTATGSNTQIALTWTVSSGATGYNVYRGTTTGGESATPIAAAIPSASYTDTGLTNKTTYYYKVAAVNSAGTSGQSNEASATPQAAVPAPPTGVTATGSNATVSLSWTASSGATSYNVYRGTASSGESATAQSTGITTTTYSDTTVTNGTTYYYKVASLDSAGTSALSTEASATPSASTTPVIAIACGGTAAYSPYVADTDYSGGGDTSWTTTVNTTLLSSPVPPIGVVQEDREGTFTYTIPNLTANASYSVTMYFVEQYFSAAGDRVFSVTCNGTTVISNLDVYKTAGAQFKAIQESFSGTASSSGQLVLSFTPSVNQAKCSGIAVYSGTPTAPAAPTGLTATGSNAQVALSWTASSGATSYNVYRGTASGGESATAVATGITTTSYTNTGLTNGTAYYYKVAALNASGTSAQSSEASATPTSGVPAAPTGLTATAGNALVALSWTASSGATSYNVYRGTASGGESATAIATGITTTSYTNTGLTNGTAYYYKVAALNASGTSAQSSEVSATPAASTLTIGIACGGTAAYSPYVADTDYSGGGDSSWTTTVNTTLLSSPVPPIGVLQEDREGTFKYTITGLTANSVHSVTMYFVEQYFGAAGDRVFSVACNGTTVISNLDVYATAGAKYKAIQESFSGTASSSGQLVFSFTASVNQAKCSGIAVY